MEVKSLDHLVLTVQDMDATVSFYTGGLGMQAEEFRPTDGGRRWALKFGAQKINLHPAQAPFEPHAAAPTVGSADLCFLTDQPLEMWQNHFATLGIAVEEGPVKRTGATGPLMSIYLRDPDGALIEISQQL